MTTLVQPSMVRVDLKADEVVPALENLSRYGMAPDGDELASWHDMRRVRAHIERGHYYHLEWPVGTTREQVLAWWTHVQDVRCWFREHKI